MGQADKVNLSREARKPGESGGADAGHLSALMSNYGGGTTSSNAGNAGKPESAGVSSVGSVSSTGNGTQAGNAAGNGTPGNGTQTGNAAGNGTPGNGTQAGNTAGNGTPGNGTQPANAGGNGTADAPPETRPGSGFLPAPVRDRDLWSVPNSEWNQLEGGGRYRSWTAGDDRGPWTEVERGGQNWRTRSYTENGTNWSETIMEGNHWRYREGGMEGLTREAEARGVTTFQLPGPDGRPLDIRVAGGASPQELARVRQSIEAMPAQARIHARNIVLSDNLGQVFGQGMVPSNGATGVGAMAGNREGRMVLDRHGLTSNQATNYLIHHEAGHNLAASSGYPETSELWRSLPGSVSPYGGRSGAEDFAETHRYVMGNWDSYVNSGAVPLAQSGNRPVRGNGPLGIERTPSAAKAMEILRLYGWKGPESGV
ncbi:MAG: hypothetical protein AMXMBFR33_09930 [Candidatus Xenobia bacterium]